MPEINAADDGAEHAPIEGDKRAKSRSGLGEKGRRHGRAGGGVLANRGTFEFSHLRGRKLRPRR